jgi:hypothetical protein
MRRFKSFLLILISLWLPLQAAAAVAMPFCRHAVERAAQLEATVQPSAHCHEQAGVVAGAVTAELDCDNCEMCHLATAGYLPVSFDVLPLLTASVMVAQQVLASPSFIAVPPQDPPRRLN